MNEWMRWIFFRQWNLRLTPAKDYDFFLVCPKLQSSNNTENCFTELLPLSNKKEDSKENQMNMIHYRGSTIRKKIIIPQIIKISVQ